MVSSIDSLTNFGYPNMAYNLCPMNPLSFPNYAQYMQAYAPNFGYLNDSSVVSPSVPDIAVDSTKSASNQIKAESGTEKNGHKGAAIATIASVALTAAAIFAHKKGPATETSHLKRTWKGLRAIVKGGKDKFLPSNSRTIQKVGGKTVVTLPGQKNVLTKTEDFANLGYKAPATEVNKIMNPETGELLSGNTLKGFRFNHRINGKDYTVICSGGNKISILDTTKVGKERNVTNIIQANNSQQYIEIKRLVEDYVSGRQKSWDGLTHIVVENKNAETGLVSKIMLNAGEYANDTKIAAVTDRFLANHKAVTSLSQSDINFRNAMRRFEDGHYDELSLLRGEYTNDIGKFVVDGEGNILEVVKEGTHIKAGMPEFTELYNSHKTVFEAVENLNKTDLQKHIYRV